MGHLEDINMSYCSHLFRAMRFGLLSFEAGLIFIIHGLFPNCFIHTGSTLINNIHQELDDNISKIV